MVYGVYIRVKKALTSAKNAEDGAAKLFDSRTFAHPLKNVFSDGGTTPPKILRIEAATFTYDSYVGWLINVAMDRTTSSFANRMLFSIFGAELFLPILHIRSVGPMLVGVSEGTRIRLS